MYIENNGQRYTCKCRPGISMVYFGLPDDLPVPIKGEVVLRDDSGFVIRTDKAEGYKTQTFQDGVLTLTNATTPAVDPVVLTAAEQREEAYNTQAVIEWEGEMLTVTEASQIWQYYAAEGDMEQAAAITARIAQVKKEIRSQWPDEGVTE